MYFDVYKFQGIEASKKKKKGNVEVRVKGEYRGKGCENEIRIRYFLRKINIYIHIFLVNLSLDYIKCSSLKAGIRFFVLFDKGVRGQKR